MLGAVGAGACSKHLCAFPGPDCLGERLPVGTGDPRLT
jgi:hypothetical protein